VFSIDERVDNTGSIAVGELEKLVKNGRVGILNGGESMQGGLQ